MTLAISIPLTDPTDGELLARFAASSPDQAAFEELVRRHIDWLYAAALRITRDPALAEDVTQAVLWSLARKARSLSHRQYLGGWLHEATRYAATTLLRSERRRKERERMLIQHTPTSEQDLNWLALQPRLDQAISRLPAPDRNVILLRFMQRKSHEEIGAALGITPEAARKRVARALERLRQKIGAKSSPLALGATLLAAPSHAAPSHLVTAVMAGKISAQAALLSKGVLLMHKALALKFICAAAALTVSAGLLFTTFTAYAQSTAAPVAPAPAAPADLPAPAAAPSNAQAPTSGIAIPAAETPVPPSQFILVAPAAPGAAAVPDAPRIITSPDGTSTIFIGDGTVSVQAGGGAFGGATGGGGGGTAGFAGARSGRGVGTSVTSNGTSTIRRTSDGTNDVTLTTTAGNTTAVVKDNTGKVIFDGPYTTDADKAKAPAEVRALLDRAAQPQPANFIFATPGIAPGRAALSLDAIKQQLGATDAEWTDIQDRIKTIQTLQGFLAAGTSAPGNLTAPDNGNPILSPVRDLNAALADPALKPEGLDPKITAVRAARIEVQDSLAKARHKLEETLTPRQKAILVNLQILE
jgi:RNA polymerase sigma factor (sigma-70 family)